MASRWIAPGTRGSSVALVLAVCAPLVAAADRAVKEGKMKFTVRVDRGKDLGQNFGSLLEVQTTDKSLVVGAGFMGVYNTRFRTDRHVVHLFVRPTDGVRQAKIERLPRPGGVAGTYMFDLDGVLHSNSPAMRTWSASEKKWLAPDDADEGMRVGDGILRFRRGTVEFNGKPILTKPAEGGYERFYYANGWLCFYHKHWAGKSGYRPYESDEKGYSKLYACPWRPGDGPADVTKAVVLTLPVVGETTFAFGQLGKQVLTGSNIGGFYVFDGQAWKMRLAPNLKRSYQIYSILNFYDRVLMGQYPAGELFEYDGREVKRLKGWPPVIPGVSTSSREAQTTAIYGGDVFQGVWPWGEVWRYSRDTGQWTSMGRMFTHPEVTNKTTHPYQNECREHKLVINQWGQRVTSFVPMGSSLMVSTSAKWPCKWAPKLGFPGKGKWLEYGSVIRLNMPGNLCVPVKWTNGPTELTFTIGGGRMRIAQDGKELASAKLTGPLSAKVDASPGLGKTGWGQGVFGAFVGVDLEGSAEASAVPR
jgi:hypothetical protein